MTPLSALPTAAPTADVSFRPPAEAGRATVRVLVLDDNEDDFAYVKILLGRSVTHHYEAEWAATGEEARAALKRGGFEVALFDYKLSGPSGLEILQALRREQIEVPVILLTGAENPAVDHAALAAGAADYLPKDDLDTTRLERAIRYAVSHARMLAELRESQAQLRLFMESVPCAVCIHDRTTGAVLFRNDLFERHFAPRVPDALEGPAAIEHGGRHWLVSSFPMVEKSGRRLQGCAAIDVTTRVEAEEALRKTSEFLNGVLATLPVAVARVDGAGTIQEARGQAFAALEQEGTRLAGGSAFQLFPEMAPLLREALAGGAVNFLAAIRRGERTRYFDNYFRHDRARGSGAMGFSIDVTARVEAERLNRQRSQLLNGLLENLPMVVGRLDARGVVVEAQGQRLERHGLAPAALVGRQLAELHPVLRPAAAEALRGGTVNAVLSGRSGEEEWFAELFLFFDRELGRGALFFGLDITQRKLIERELLRVSDAEKDRIGGDLHDGLGQYLTGISCLSAALRDRLNAAGRPESADAATISGLVQEAIAQTRALARGLCPVQLETAGLEVALEDLAAQVQRLHGIPCAFEARGPAGGCEQGTAVHLYRIAQEALNNAVKHAAARHLRLTLDFAQEPRRLVVEDDGCGFDPAASHGPGSGLSLMPYRAAMIGGTLTVTSQPHAGTRVECTFLSPS